LAQSSIRFSLGRFTTPEEIEYAAICFRNAVAHLQAMFPDPQFIVNG
jgi:cysteine sulfinate desulfinase/cysteine desulfurase-like protein